MLNLYEAMYIMDPALSEQEVESLAERLKSEILERGGDIVDVQHLGKKRLAYPIAKKRDGFYCLFYFHLAPDRLSELKSGYRLMDSILRFLILRKKEQELQPTPEAAPGGGHPAEAEAEDASEKENGEEAPQQVDEEASSSEETEKGVSHGIIE